MASETLVEEEGYKTAEDEEVSGVVESPGRDEETEEGSGKSGKKRRRTSTSTPIQRPSRERKAVQWYSVEVNENVASPKGLIIQQGNGTLLKDIPNVVFKLSKRKTDDNLQNLHRILFGKKTKMHNVKKNLQQFSGFVWEENEVKQREKITERLDKFIREQLLDFCDVLDIPVSTATKKDEIIRKLLEFLESPHATTEVSLADRKQSQKTKKRKRKKQASTGSASRGTSAKKRKQSAKDKRSEDEVEDDVESEDNRHLSDEDGSLVTVRKEERNQDDDESPVAEDKAKVVKVSKRNSAKKSMKRGSEAKAKAEKGTPKNVGNSIESESPSEVKESPGKPLETPHFSENGAATEDKFDGSPSQSKDSTCKNRKGNEKKSEKDQSAFSEGKKTSDSEVQSPGEEGTNSVKGNVPEPSRDEIHAAASEILKEMDFNTATLLDVLKKLGTVFGMDLLHRKLEVKNIIEEVMTNMPDDEDEDEGEDDAEEADNGSEEDINIADNGGEKAAEDNDH